METCAIFPGNRSLFLRPLGSDLILGNFRNISAIEKRLSEGHWGGDFGAKRPGVEMGDSKEIGEKIGVQRVFTGVGGDFLIHQSLALTETLTVTLITGTSVLSSHTPGSPGHQPFRTAEETEAGNQSF